MTRLVYWYGTHVLDPLNAYSFVTKKSCLTYEEGVARGCDKLAKNIQKKLDAGKSLSKTEQCAVEGLEELKGDLKKKPEDRKHMDMGAFKELHELESEDDSVVEDQIDVDELEDIEEEVPVPAKKKKETKEKETKKKKRKAQQSSLDEEDFGEDEITSEEEDEEAQVPESELDDDEDLDYALEPKSQKKSRKRKSDDAPSSKSTTKKAKLERKRTKKISKQAAYKMEQQRFEECEAKYLPLVQHWKISLKAKHVDKLVEIMEELMNCVELFTGSFILAYKLPQLMRNDTKPLLKGDNEHLKKYKEVWAKMKRTFEEDEGPEGFTPKMGSNKIKKSPARKLERPKTAESPVPQDIPPSSSNDAKVGNTRDESLTNETAEGTTIPSPMRIPKTKESNKYVPGSPPLSRESTLGEGKSERKAFSLSHLIQPKAQDSQGSDHPGRILQNTKENEDTMDTPSWLTSVPGADDSLTMNDDRAFALEFFQDAASRFPPEKANREAVARALEKAVFRWAKDNHGSDWVDPYWRKVHALVAAICGKRETGPIVGVILKGKYASARDLVLAPDETLEWSFGE